MSARDELPERWARTTVAHAASAPVVYGILQPGPDRPDGIPYVRPTEIQNDIIQVADLRRTSKKIAEKYHRSSLEASDIILSIVGTIGKVALVPPELIGANITQSSARIRLPREFILPRFGAYALRSPLLVNQFNVARLGTAVPRLNLAHVRDLLLPVAPLGEQHRIVEAIESYFTRLDDAVATLERVQRNLKRYRASVLKAAVEGRLVPTEASVARAEGRDYEPASVLLDRILAERRRRWEEAELAKMKAKGKTPKDGKWKAKYMEPVAPETEELPELPEGWCWASPGQFFSWSSGDFLPKTAQRGGPVPVIGGNGVNGSHDEPLVTTPTIVVGRVGAHCGNIHLTDGPVWITDNAIYASEGCDLSVLPYWRMVMSMQNLNANAGGTGQPYVNQKHLNDLVIPLAPEAEQQRIVQETERLDSLTNRVHDDTRSSAERCGRLRQSILKWAFEGRLADQDPTDEPASRLLERIRAEREAKPAQPSRTRRRARTTTKDRT